MLWKKLENLTAADINSIVENKVREGKGIEYKRDLPGRKDQDRKEFLADVSSFANSGGGDILFGVDEERNEQQQSTGLPARVSAIANVQVDAEVRRMEEMIRSGIEPRIPSVRLQVVDGFEDGCVIVLRIYPSWRGPHMVTFSNSSRFFMRGNAGKVQMGIDEIRAAFQAAGDLPARVSEWREERLKRINANRGPVVIDQTGILVVHLVPLQSFADPWRFAPAELRKEGVAFPLLKHRPVQPRINLDGVITSIVSSAATNQHDAYTQVFRSGSVEAVLGRLIRPIESIPYLSPVLIETWVVEAISRFLASFRSLETPPPIVAMVSLLKVGGTRLALPREMFMYHDTVPIDRQIVRLPDVVIEEFDVDVASIFRPSFDALWNAGGFLHRLG
jgi:hypothetical protein